jgi:hypothetical protein
VSEAGKETAALVAQPIDNIRTLAHERGMSMLSS